MVENEAADISLIYHTYVSTIDIFIQIPVYVLLSRMNTGTNCAEFNASNALPKCKLPFVSKINHLRLFHVHARLREGFVKNILEGFAV